MDDQGQNHQVSMHDDGSMHRTFVGWSTNCCGPTFERRCIAWFRLAPLRLWPTPRNRKHCSNMFETCLAAFHAFALSSGKGCWKARNRFLVNLGWLCLGAGFPHGILVLVFVAENSFTWLLGSFPRKQMNRQSNQGARSYELVSRIWTSHKLQPRCRQVIGLTWNPRNHNLPPWPP